MNGFGEGLIQIADGIVAGIANAGVAFGWFPDGRDHVDLLPGKGFQTLSFPDHGDEGWPAFEVRIPESFEFDGAAFSILGRRAHLRSAGCAQTLAAEFESLAGFALDLEMGRGWSTTLASGVEIALVEREGGGATLGVRQTRSAEDLEAAMRRRGRCGGAGTDDGEPPDDAEPTEAPTEA